MLNEKLSVGLNNMHLPMPQWFYFKVHGQQKCVHMYSVKDRGKNFHINLICNHQKLFIHSTTDGQGNILWHHHINFLTVMILIRNIPLPTFEAQNKRLEIISIRTLRET